MNNNDKALKKLVSLSFYRKNIIDSLVMINKEVNIYNYLAATCYLINMLKILNRKIEIDLKKEINILEKIIIKLTKIINEKDAKESTKKLEDIKEKIFNKFMTIYFKVSKLENRKYDELFSE